MTGSAINGGAQAGKNHRGPGDPGEPFDRGAPVPAEDGCIIFIMDVNESGALRHLPEITRRIISISDPDQIILFGSYARGDFHQDSDLDLLIIKDQVHSTQEEAAKIYRALANMGLPIDVVVVSKAYVQRYGDLIGTVVRPALKEGKVIYAR
jgi:predicted nucleotidyltransferase